MLFKSSSFNLGSVKAGQKAKFRFEFKEGINLPVEWIKWGCSCTTGTKVVDGQFIEGEIDITQAGVLQGTNTISKGIIVKLKDGQCEYVVDANSDIREAIINKQALRETITLVGNRSDINV